MASHLFDDGVEPLELVEARAVVAAFGLGVLHWWRRGRFGRRTQKRRPQRRAILGVVALGIALALVNLAYYLAIDRLAVAVAIVLQYSAPALVVIWTAVVGRRRPSQRVVLSLIGALAGVILVSEVLGGDVGSLDAFGIAMGLASAALFATYTLLSEAAESDFGPLGAVFRAFAAASLFWIVVQIPIGWPAALFERENILSVLFVGLAGTLAPFLLYVWGVARVRSERASIAATLEPVLAALFAWVWLDQSLSALQIAGGLLVIAAVAGLHVTRAEAAHV